MNKWEVVPFFDYDDYYQVGRTVMVDGKYKFESKGIRYRDCLLYTSDAADE